MDSRLKDYLDDIVARAQMDVDFYSSKSSELCADGKTVSALCFKITVIGEIGMRLREHYFEVLNAFDFPWPKIIGARHVIARGYESIDLNRAEDIAVVNLLQIAKLVSHNIKENAHV